MKGEVHTNGIEGLWCILKRAYKGMCHKLLDRFVQEFAGCHNVREPKTIDQMESLRNGMEGKRPTNKALIKDNGLSSGRVQPDCSLASGSPRPLPLSQHQGCSDCLRVARLGLDLRHGEVSGPAMHFERRECESAAKVRGRGRVGED